MRVFITGADGFIGRNLRQVLGRRPDTEVAGADIATPLEELLQQAEAADYLIHLAGANRPKDAEDFRKVNTDLTSLIAGHLRKAGRKPVIVFSSSTQALNDNDYGRSKREAEQVLQRYATETGSDVRIFRFPNVFGKWSRPYYNSAIATFCHQAAHGESLSVNDPSAPLNVIYVDDVVRLIVNVIDGRDSLESDGLCIPEPVYSTTVGEIAEIIRAFPAIRKGGILPDFDNPLEKYLYSTYLSFLPPGELAYATRKMSDERGYLFEMVKSKHSGQIFVSRTVPGITRGNHYHDTKVEKFCVVEGQARIALRHLATNEVTTFDVRGEDCVVVDIAPGYTHAICNTGETDLVTIFWANEPFDADRPDTYYEKV